MQPVGRVAALRQLMLEHHDGAAVSTAPCPMFKPEIALVELPFWTIEERALAQISLPGMPTRGERRDAQKDLTWILAGFDGKSMSYPGQAFNTAEVPFFTVEVMALRPY